jgi:hypothetical protein
MNIKYIGCKFEGCDKPHRRNGYCANHSQKFKRGTLYLEKTQRLCVENNCKRKHYAKGLCLRHYNKLRIRRISDINSNFRSEFEIGNLNFSYKECTSWARAVKRVFGNKCMECGWNEDTCDVHHIIPKSQDGLNTLSNAIILCPNHHKLADIGKLSKEYLQTITNNKINSLSVELEGNKNECLDNEVA